MKCLKTFEKWVYKIVNDYDDMGYNSFGMLEDIKKNPKELEAFNELQNEYREYINSIKIWNSENSQKFDHYFFKGEKFLNYEYLDEELKALYDYYNEVLTYETWLDNFKNDSFSGEDINIRFPILKRTYRHGSYELYNLSNRKEVEEYLTHPILSKRIIEITEALMIIQPINWELRIFYSIDVNELNRIHASMTMFYLVSNNIVFKKVLDKWFNGEYHKDTVERLKELDNNK